jgi:hypothetical protein
MKEKEGRLNAIKLIIHIKVQNKIIKLHICEPYIKLKDLLVLLTFYFILFWYFETGSCYAVQATL